MNATAILIQLLASAPNILGLVQKLAADIHAGKGTAPLTDADWQVLIALGYQTSADIYKREGVTPPPSA
jgi:hypothetical protein